MGGSEMTYTNESGLMDDIYDYLFENEANIGLRFLDEFPDAFVDSANARIYLQGGEIGDYVLKIERVSK
jgi:hypothetical protein